MNKQTNKLIITERTIKYRSKFAATSFAEELLTNLKLAGMPDSYASLCVNAIKTLYSYSSNYGNFHSENLSVSWDEVTDEEDSYLNVTVTVMVNVNEQK